MTRLLTLLVIGTLTGCVSTPIELPDWEIPEATETATYPLSLPERPAATVNAAGMAEFTKEGMLQLRRYTVAAETNTEIATANAVALEAQSRAFNALIDAGKLQRQVGQIRGELLEIERRDHRMDNWFHRGLIALGLIAVSL